MFFRRKPKGITAEIHFKGGSVMVVHGLEKITTFKNSVTNDLTQIEWTFRDDSPDKILRITVDEVVGVKTTR